MKAWLYDYGAIDLVSESPNMLAIGRTGANGC